MVEDALDKDEFLHETKDAYGCKAWIVVDANNIIKTSEQGMNLEEVAKYAGLDLGN